ncbi:thioesterase II family protein [Streptomyces purpureus]|uniref:Thioesterase n=1 Tax=Streptomyces purpureus TaxID=1951 RepID=A0A918LVG2_9ACTN|nr:thioesterase II family protein [Streptomyces purpureus]GGT59474.1 thioesterase [Streptomyces purpureus]
MTSTASTDAWIRRYHPAPDVGIRLVTLPHAGGSAPWFRPFSAALSPQIEVLSVQYPGRQDRFREEPVTDIATLADHITEALAPWTDGPLALFGHSMGATVGFEVAQRLERLGTPPVAFFASGRPAPGLDRKHLIHRLDDAGLLAELRTLSGTDPRVFEDEELLQLMIPVVRGDYRAVETYRCAPGARVDCPVTVLVGDSDPRVSPDDAAAWDQHTSRPIDFHVFPGGHFYLADHQEAITALVRDALAPYTR